MTEQQILKQLIDLAIQAESLGYAVMIFDPESIKKLHDNDSDINYSHIINSMHEDRIGLLVGGNNL